MGKAKALKHNANKGKQQLHEIKGGSIKKNKDSKFKNTPKDQELAPNKNKISKKYWDQKASPSGNAVAKQSKQDFPNKKQNFKQSTNSSKAQKIGKKTFNSKKMEKQLDKSNSNTIESEDDSSNKSDETSESDSDIPDIFDRSLKESDDEDEDYEEEKEDTDNDDVSDEEEMDDDDSDEEEMSECKGVTMFKGLQSKTKKNKKGQKEDDEVESNENTTESDEDDDEDDTDEDEDKDMEKQKKKDDHIEKPKIRIIKNYAEFDSTVLENSDSDDYSNDTTDYSDDEDAELGTKVLLEQTIADDDEDEDFNEEDKDTSDEDDISSEEDSENDDVKREANENENSIMKKFNLTLNERDDLAKRIVVIDNIPKTTSVDEIIKLCEENGKIELFKARPYPAFFLNSQEQKYVGVLEWLNKDYPHLETYSANVLYFKPSDAWKAMKLMHGTKIDGNFLNVVTADKSELEPEHAVYITNIKSTMPDNFIWEIFKRCGTIDRMRNVRDPVTGLSRGFGYVSFFDTVSAKIALDYNNEKFHGWRIKVVPYPYHENTSVESLIGEMQRKNQAILDYGQRTLDNRSSKKFKKSSGEPANVESERNVKKHKKQEGDKKTFTAFQGQMVELKNKNKKNKLDKKKKKMAEKLVAKSKKTKKN
ncbi:PREDICTED: nucleolar protein 12-like isoform X2 [Trachymyrmex cornetzi]|uniref:RNA-binding protein 34 n=1 Tax=Trachymyrmex cornetzi TaxID=471704 RepID=A0A195DZ83_9HYME|nr:PREDICTED: nucleolar protein 12-like isoform X2 [Trachymyrmex cornetzi]KYN17939.1 RNA-binding protein 34 [Trachymyrmex cornetzi]